MNRGEAAGQRPHPGPHLAQCEPPQWPGARIWGHHKHGPSRGAPPDPRWGRPLPKCKPQLLVTVLYVNRRWWCADVRVSVWKMFGQEPLGRMRALGGGVSSVGGPRLHGFRNRIFWHSKSDLLAFEIGSSGTCISANVRQAPSLTRLALAQTASVGIVRKCGDELKPWRPRASSLEATSVGRHFRCAELASGRQLEHLPTPGLALPIDAATPGCPFCAAVKIAQLYRLSGP
eukprot:359315-Chlamydomonas_euryale.AAC.1